MHVPLSELYKEKDALAALKALARIIETNRARESARTIKSEIKAIKKEHKEAVQKIAKETKAGLKSLKNQIDASMAGELSKKVQTSAASKIKDYNTIID